MATALKLLGLRRDHSRFLMLSMCPASRIWVYGVTVGVNAGTKESGHLSSQHHSSACFVLTSCAEKIVSITGLHVSFLLSSTILFSIRIM